MLLVRMLDLREETRKIQILSVSAGQRASDENESRLSKVRLQIINLLT